MKRILVVLRNKVPFSTVLVLLFSIIFSTWLMFHTFSYDPGRHTIRVGTRLWSDFAAHIPLIRSFSMGDNLTGILKGKFPEYPLFPGEPIRYHFLFFMFVGILERLGVRIDWALNIPSILGFSLLMVMIYVFAKRVFGDYRVGILSLLFFLLNGSLSFLAFFQKHAPGANSINDIIHANEFPSFAPWGPGDITAFWNLNIYTNQRHLGAAFGIALLFLYTLVVLDGKKYRAQLPWSVAWGVIIAGLPFFHQPTLLIVAIFGVVYFLLFSKLRWFLLVSGGIAAIGIMLQFPFLQQGSGAFSYYPGYLLHDSLTAHLPVVEKVIRFLSYWFQNLGGHMIMAPIGFLIASKRVKKVFAPLLLLFLIPNIFKFSVEIAGSHKFFNFFLIMASMLSAYAIVRVFSYTYHLKFHLPVFNLFSRFARVVSVTGVTRAISFASVAILLVFLTLSGIIDFFVVANDPLGTLPDIRANPIAAWIAKNTPTDAVFLNSSFLYHPASMAGRKIYLGWPYFAWSAGYDAEGRGQNFRNMFQGRNLHEHCARFRRENISYITIEDTKDDPNLPKIDIKYYRTNFQPVYSNPGKTFFIFDVHQVCQTSV